MKTVDNIPDKKTKTRVQETFVYIHVLLCSGVIHCELWSVDLQR